MVNRKMEWAIYTDPKTGDTANIKYIDIDRDEYNSKYKHHLSCINQCKAKIKFTKKSNGIKYFSNSSKEGKNHDEGCQFGVQYKGRDGKKKLIAYYERLNVSKEDIKNSIKYKIATLKRKYNNEDSNKKQTYTSQTDNDGEENVNSQAINDNPNIEDTTIRQRKQRIMSIDANHITKDYVGITKNIYGKVKSAEISVESGEYYGYLNLKNDDYNVAIYCPKAFYSQENGINESEFKNLFIILKNEINDSNRDFVVVCYGEVRKKKGKGVNIQVIDSDFIVINEMTMKEILYLGKINDIDYDIV